MRPTISATWTYYYRLAKRLDENLKPLSVNSHTVFDIFQFAEDFVKMEMNASDTLVSYDINRSYAVNEPHPSIEIAPKELLLDLLSHTKTRSRVTQCEGNFVI